ncbi:MAG: hypothetical protein WC868_00515 [Bacteroidales bacterium]
MKKIFVFIFINVTIFLSCDLKAQDNITIDDAKTFIKKYVNAFPILTATYPDDPNYIYDYGAGNFLVWDDEETDETFYYGVMFSGGFNLAYRSLDDNGAETGIAIKDIQDITVKNNPIINQIEIHLELKKGKYVRMFWLSYTPMIGISLPYHTSESHEGKMSEIIIYMDRSSLAEDYPNRIKKAFEFLVEKCGGNLYKDKF